MQLTAHRGLSSLAPENTMSAFKLAIEHDVPWIELDVQLSSDNIPMVIHDFTVNRCTNGRGLVTQLSSHELKQLDAGIWFGDEFEHEQIPTLEEVLVLIKTHKTCLNIELKVSDNKYVAELCAHVAKVIKRLDIPENLLLFSSFNTQALLTIKEHLPSIRRGHLWQGLPNNALDILKNIDAFSAHCDYRFIDSSDIESLHTNGYKAFCYTLNFTELTTPLIQGGIDNIITDCPHLLIKK